MTHRPLFRPALRHSLLALSAALPLAFLMAAAPAEAAVVISQVYGGGGNSGATFKHDFIEIFNAGSSTENIGGWSLQYAAAAGSSWQVTAIPAGTTLAAGRYFLVRQAMGAGGTVDVAGDLIGTIAMAGASGKVALTSSSAALTGSAPSGVQDIVSYGAATPTEGTATGMLSNTTAAQRNNAGCTDSGNNSADFSLVAPAPRNSASTAAPCAGTPAPAPAPAPAPVVAAIYTVQGSGSSSPLAGQVVTSSGVVTKLTNSGFFMQDLVGDNNPATSDGIFVYTGAAAFPAAAVGNMVQVTGTVTEFNVGAAGNTDTAAHTVTELTSVTAVTQTGSGYSISPTVVNLPEAVEGDLERFEGMLVRLTGPFTVAQNYFQGRFGQLTLAVGGRLETPTNRFRPGPQARALADQNARSRIILDDGSSLQNPNPTPYLDSNALPRAGDTVASITGVIDYGLATSSNTGFGDYKIHPTVAPVFTLSNLRSAAPEAVGGNITVASFNVLNYFTTFTNGQTASGQTGQGCSLGSATSASNCRGADSLAEFVRQRAKIVEAMAALNADVLGLMEIQNNGLVAVQNLVDALNAKVGAGTYASTPLPAQGTGTDAIRVAMVYKPSRLGLLGAPVSDTDPVNNRPTLAQSFVLSNGERFSLLVNHFKSKGSCPAAGAAEAAGNTDSGDGQGCWNALRQQQAQRLRSFVATVQTAAGSNDVLLIGDLNAYAQEDPVFDLTSNGYIDQIGRFNSFGYSYVFDGGAGRLDHAIASPTLSARVSRASHWHINADETVLADYNLEYKAPLLCNGSIACSPDPYSVSPYRSSDHDPVVVGLNLYKTFYGAASRGALVGSAGDDLLIGGPGANTMTGGAGRNVFVYQSMRDAGDTITDFVPGKDRIDLTALLASIGASAASASANGVVKLVANGAHTWLQIDADGSAGPQAVRTLATLLNVSPAQISPSRDLGLQ
jgi:predicted extracellular nuclease